MCGIAGAVSLNHEPLPVERLKPMVDVIAHRGPDDAGYLVYQTGTDRPFGQDFTDSQFQDLCPLLPVIDSSPRSRSGLHSEKWNLFFGHRRLSIIDLSPRGHQPMCDKSRKIWLIYNGEIYNFREIRQELRGLGYHFSSASDTEIIIHAYHQWGTDCIHRFNGMFACALYDSRNQKVWLARDRYGIKPLYYTLTDEGTFLFGSEIKSILEYLPERPDVDLAALNEYFSFQNIFSDRTLFSGITLLPPGHYLELDLSLPALPPNLIGRKISKTKYWDFDFMQETSVPEYELEDQLYDRLTQAIKRQCVSDVPVGSYLSGGMDSGTVTAITASVFGRIATFTIGFDLSEAADHELSFDERELAKYMANLFQTTHHERVLHSGDMEAVMGNLIWHLEDLRVGQCYPNYYAARLASEQVKVVISGTGGDELFGGYPWRYAAAIGNSPDAYMDNYYRYWQRLVYNREKSLLFNQEVTNQLCSMDIDGATPFKNHTLTAFRNVYPKDIRCDSREEQVNHSLYFECKTFLHGLLVVEDKMSMAHSLETRVPLLDNDLVDLACQTPVRYKIANLREWNAFNEDTSRTGKVGLERTDAGKEILRKTMGRIIPKSVTQAKKQGFSGPDESWFRGSSEKYVRDLLLDDKARINEYLNPEYVRQILETHRSGIENKRLLIWSLLSFEWWLKQFIT
ncbi:asparagine synthase (glutamine-hydrolyzing) [Candidatus Poribacteria bacterium]|nr:MAG: asparagine synthase (glutamine-hydrolyzing) [Candidatus Poribacteria bacterium]